MDELRKLVIAATQATAPAKELGLKGLQRFEPLRLPEVMDNSKHFWVVFNHSIGCWIQDGPEFRNEADCQKECDRLNQEDNNAAI